jgi:hypothetical protein
MVIKRLCRILVLVFLTQVHWMLLVEVMMRDNRTSGHDGGWELEEPNLWTKPKPSEHRQKPKVPGEQPSIMG